MKADRDANKWIEIIILELIGIIMSKATKWFAKCWIILCTWSSSLTESLSEMFGYREGIKKYPSSSCTAAGSYEAYEPWIRIQFYSDFNIFYHTTGSDYPTNWNVEFRFGATTYLKFQDAFMDGMHELPMVWVGQVRLLRWLWQHELRQLLLPVCLPLVWI